MSFAFSKDLFIAEDGTAMNFCLSDCENPEELNEYIKYGGGLVEEKIGPFSIMILDAPRDSFSVKQESFQSDFIVQCCCKNKVLQLSQFRWNSLSLYSAEFDPNKVLQHKLSWRMVGEQYKRTSDDSYGSISFVEEKQRLTKSTGPQLSRRGGTRTEFTHLERQQMVKYIVENNAIDEIRGTILWKNMEQKITTHTWQSLKEHFLKKVMPLIHSYKLSPDVVQKLRYAMKAKSVMKPNVASYSTHEDKLILKYVSNHALKNTALGGNQFWIKMEREHLLPNRTWQSVRERYLKCLKNKTLSDFQSDDESSAESSTGTVHSHPSISKDAQQPSTSFVPPQIELPSEQIAELNGVSTKPPSTLLPSDCNDSSDETMDTEILNVSFNSEGLGEVGNTANGFSQRPNLNKREASNVLSSSVVSVNGAAQCVGVQVATIYTRDVGVQTNPVIVLPPDWRLSLQDELMSPPPSPSQVTAALPDSCPSPVPADMCSCDSFESDS